MIYVLQQLLALAGAIVILYNACSAIWKATRPAANIKQSLEDHEDDIQDLKSSVNNIQDSVDHLIVNQKAIIAGMISEIDHMIDGNAKEKMQSTRNKLIDIMKDI